LSELKPRDIDRSSPHSECMTGTRQNIFARIDEWLTDFDAPNILWVKGLPGAGKSAIASSLVERLVQSRRLGASFFFQRNKPDTTTPSTLWRMVAFELSRQYPSARKSLVAKLREDEIRPTTGNIEKLFQHYVYEPLVASGDIPVGRLPVIVVDALDECGGNDGPLSAKRKDLMNTLEDWSKLPSKFKLVVTSRGEIDIEQTFRTISHVSIVIGTGKDVDPQSSKDIRTYLEYEFKNIVLVKSSLSADWPGESTIDKLTKDAAGLFIWAKTVIRFIKMGVPRTQLELITERVTFNDLNSLYSELLKIAFPYQDMENTKAIRSILATIILSGMSLPDSSIINLLNIERDVIEDVCERMKSVLDTQNVLQISHKSFEDFLLDEKACPSSFHIKLDYWRQFLTIPCLNTMERGLKFNICELKSSYLRNREVTGLAEQVEKCIPPELSYSCRFWAENLSKSDYDDKLYFKIQQFMEDEFLYWLEVLSLCNQVNQASRTLKLLNDWIVVSFYLSIA
jgi:hypothetical protein